MGSNQKQQVINTWLAIDDQQNVTPLTRTSPSSQNLENTQSTTRVRCVVILFQFLSGQQLCSTQTFSHHRWPQYRLPKKNGSKNNGSTNMCKA
jgi:hypothetical protein